MTYNFVMLESERRWIPGRSPPDRVSLVRGFGGPRSGRTYHFVMPDLIRHPVSLLANDLSGRMEGSATYPAQPLGLRLFWFESAADSFGNETFSNARDTAGNPGDRAGRHAPFSDAQQYPSKPLGIIVASTPGSGADLVARAIAPKLTEAFGQQTRRR
jgi:hypothetical protein